MARRQTLTGNDAIWVLIVMVTIGTMLNTRILWKRNDLVDSSAIHNQQIADIAECISEATADRFTRTSMLQWRAALEEQLGQELPPLPPRRVTHLWNTPPAERSSYESAMHVDHWEWLACLSAMGGILILEITRVIVARLACKIKP